MQLSILIPMYNSEKYIERCLKSILDQNIPKNEFEVIVLDDGSSDNSALLVQNYVNSYENIFLYKDKNEGTYTSRNKLLHLAKGKYIYNIDADDYLAGGLLKDLLHIALKNNLEVLSFGAIKTFKDDDFQIKNDAPVEHIPVVMDGQQFILENPYHRNEVWWYFFSADLLRKKNLFFEKNEYNADVVFTIKLLLATQRIAYIPVDVYRYFQSDDSLMRNTDSENRKKLINYLLQMVLDLNNLIEELEQDVSSLKPKILNVLRVRRDRFIKTLIVKMIKGKISKKEMGSIFKTLESNKVYPIKNYIVPEKKALQHKLISHIVNSKRLTYMISKIYP